MNFSVEVECGYIRKDGGNFDGVCHGLDQAVSLILKNKREKYKALIPKYSCKFGILKWETTKHPGAL